MSKARCIASKDVTTCVNSARRCLEDVTDVRQHLVVLRRGVTNLISWVQRCDTAVALVLQATESLWLRCDRKTKA